MITSFTYLFRRINKHSILLEKLIAVNIFGVKQIFHKCIFTLYPYYYLQVQMIYQQFLD